MNKTHRPYHRTRAGNHFSNFLDLLSISQRVSHRLTFGDATDAALRWAFFPFVFIVFFPTERQNYAVYSHEIGTARECPGTATATDEI